MISSTASDVLAPGWLGPVAALTWREIVRFLRQRSRLVGALLQPALFWVLFGAGLSGSFQTAGGQSYQAYFLPGIAVMIVMFTAIFSAISVIQDRQEGFLQGVLVSPASRTSIVLGKLFGGSALAVGQGVLFLAVAPLFSWLGLSPTMDLPSSPLAWLLATAQLTVIALGLCGLGYAFAWRLNSVQGFHAVMSVLLFPLWLLSGAFFPVAKGGWLAWLMRVNPLTYGLAGLRRVLATSEAVVADLPTLSVCLAVSVSFAAGCLLVDVWLTHRPAPSP
jgi:ABC-2 type transport system permease protein